MFIASDPLTGVSLVGKILFFGEKIFLSFLLALGTEGGGGHINVVSLIL